MRYAQSPQLTYNEYMIRTHVHTFHHSDGSPQRVQTVTFDDWSALDFVFPKMTPAVFQTLTSVYTEQMVKAYPWYFGTLHLSAGEMETVIRGRRPFRHNDVSFQQIGFLSDTRASLLVNASFFTFDLLDCDSPYDHFGTPVGLLVKDGKILSPAMYDRAVLSVDVHGHVSVLNMNITDTPCDIPGRVFCRPQYRSTPRTSGTDIVIIGDRVIAVHPGGHTRIPSSGFVVQTDRTGILPGDTVHYSGMEDILFAVQGGTWAVRDGVIPDGFTSPFCHPLRPFRITFPPARYPLNYDHDRAPRILLGAYRDGSPVLVWMEGAAKNGASSLSTGASLREAGMIMQELGIYNAVHLDGGGSAEILLDGKRYLQLSGRDAHGNEEERPVPVGLMIK